MRKLTIKAVLENMDTALSFVDQELEAMDCPMKVQVQIDIALDELLSNIMRYAYGDGEGDVTIQMGKCEDSEGVKITFIDSGIPYDPLAKPDPNILLSAESREIGGLGIYMVKKSMDQVSYEYLDGKNQLSICKLFG